MPHALRRSLDPRLPVLVTVLLTAALSGCEQVTGPAGDPSPPEPITQLPRELSAAEVDAIRASNAFGFDLIREVVSGEPGSTVFLSPFSASMALGMTLNGADGHTFDEMRTALRFGSLSEEQINASYRDLLSLLSDLDPDVELAVANSVWHREELALRETFRERVGSYFGARVEGIDFAAPGAAEKINAWVREATRDRIEDIVEDPLPSDVIAYLINAVYFNAGWSDPFDPDLTRTETFHALDGTSEPVEMMVRDDTLRFAQGERYRAVDLPYGGGAFSMTVVVPTEDSDIHELIGDLDGDAWGELTSRLATSRVQLWLPRFELEWEGALNDPLAAMGMPGAFQPGADFSRMFEATHAWIDEVKQKSFIRVDEEGTEAAAATSVAMISSMPPVVRADRPFLFAIRERLSGTVLFIGSVIEAPPAPSE